jgi:hypothetical protein
VQAVFPEQRDDPQLSGAVAAAVNGPHDRCSLCLAKAIAHNGGEKKFSQITRKLQQNRLVSFHGVSPRVIQFEDAS